MEDRESLILSHTKFVSNLTRKYLPSTVAAMNGEDAKQESLLALCKAVDSFDQSKRTQGGISEYIGSKIFYSVKDFARYKVSMIGSYKKGQRNQPPSRCNLRDIGVDKTEEIENLAMVSSLYNLLENTYPKNEVEILKDWSEGLLPGELAAKHGLKLARVKFVLSKLISFLKRKFQ
jgi:hypothetical protein